MCVCVRARACVRFVFILCWFRDWPLGSSAINFIYIRIKLRWIIAYKIITPEHCYLRHISWIQAQISWTLDQMITIGLVQFGHFPKGISRLLSLPTCPQKIITLSVQYDCFAVNASLDIKWYSMSCTRVIQLWGNLRYLLSISASLANKFRTVL
jgi:hypothetical protein